MKKTYSNKTTGSRLRSMNS